MDRRRYVPAAEGLEGRALLSLLGSTPRPEAEAQVGAPNSYQQKTTRVEQLPRYLARMEPGRPLPGDLMDGLRDDLNALKGRLRTPPDEVVDAFNAQLRDVLAQSGIRPEDVLRLNHHFGSVLEAAGAEPAEVARLKEDMARLAAVDARAPQAVSLVSNDYALVLQTALGIGKPIRRPGPARLVPSDNTGSKDDNATAITQPRFAGTYDPGTTIQLLDGSGEVLGSAPVGKDGRFTVAPSRPLAPGTYSLSVRAVADDVVFSPPSAPVRLRVNAPPTTVYGAAHPGGPAS